MKAMEKELADLKKAAADALKRRKKGKDTAESSDPAADVMDTAPMEEDAELAANRKVLNPPIATTKGRPSEKRKKGGLQLQKPRVSTCAVCNEKGHEM